MSHDALNDPRVRKILFADAYNLTRCVGDKEVGGETRESVAWRPKGFIWWHERREEYWWSWPPNHAPRRFKPRVTIRFKAKPPEHYKRYFKTLMEEKELSSALAKPKGKSKKKLPPR